MSTRGQSRPLALEQCSYERGCTQIEKKPLKSRQQGRSAQTRKKLDLTCTSHVSQQRHSASDGIHSFPYLHGTKSRKRQAGIGHILCNGYGLTCGSSTATTLQRVGERYRTVNAYYLYASATASNPTGDKLTKAKHTNTDLPTIIAADTASHPYSDRLTRPQHTNTDLPIIIAAGPTVTSSHRQERGRRKKTRKKREYQKYVH